jgi:hypothetical protein
MQTVAERKQTVSSSCWHALLAADHLQRPELVINRSLNVINKYKLTRTWQWAVWHKMSWSDKNVVVCDKTTHISPSEIYSTWRHPTFLFLRWCEVTEVSVRQLLREYMGLPWYHISSSPYYSQDIH